MIRSDNKKKDMKKDDDKQRQTLIDLQEQQIEQMDDFKREYINRGWTVVKSPIKCNKWTVSLKD